MQVKTTLLLTALMVTCVPAWSGTITVEFTVNMDWRYNLATNALDPAFQPFTIDVQAVLDDQRTGSLFLPPDTTRILFGGVNITSPLSELLDMGYDLSTLNARTSMVTVQDTFITDANQGTWTDFYEEFYNDDASLSLDLLYAADLRLVDPASFSSTELRSLLASQLGDTYGFREDITFPGGGFQNHGNATLTPSPSTNPLHPSRRPGC